VLDTSTSRIYVHIYLVHHSFTLPLSSDLGESFFRMKVDCLKLHSELGIVSFQRKNVKLVLKTLGSKVF
jgi:hypothetical protein